MAAKKVVGKADKSLTVDDLSPDQLSVFNAMTNWAEDKCGGLLTVGGYAGTGKSSILGVFAERTPLLVAYVSFTGRASSVLRRKLEACYVKTTNLLQADDNRAPVSGYSYSSLDDEADLPFCGTIHRLLYKPVVDKTTEEILGWTKRTDLDRGYDLIVIDEASMVGDEMLQDLQVHGVPILAVGDHGQLPPVMSAGNLMDSPHLTLEKIHRQAEGNPIIQLSRVVRETGRLDPQYADGERVIFASRAEAQQVLRAAYAKDTPLDVGVLCWTNRMRVKLNGAARVAAEFEGVPREDEVVICLKNKPPVFNGMRGILTKDAVQTGAPWHLQARIAFPEEGLSESGFTLCSAQFNRDKAFASVDELQERGINVKSMGGAGELYDFGYAMTTHKSQGSSFKHAIFYRDMPAKPNDTMYRRLVYTAITRASERLTILT